MIDRAEAIRRIRAGLRKTTGRTWSVITGGTGYGYYCWLTISSLPRERIDGECLSESDRALLAQALGLSMPVSCQGQVVSLERRGEFVARAEGRFEKATA